MFIDRIQLKISAGRGGDGVVAWRREKYIPKGGPYGGNGGPGGSVYIRGNPQIFSLDPFRNQRIIKAENGKPGGSNNQQGKKGEDLLIDVPLGTLVKDAETGVILYDVIDPNDCFLLLHGGKGGKGNSFYKTSTRQAPNYSTLGTKGETKMVELELKLIADIGLVGMPNAGKSTLLCNLTQAPAKVGAYPFTTLKPNLGFLVKEDGSRIYIADIPGIIKNAHENKGLGLSFLKHIERTTALLFVIDLTEADPCLTFEILQQELDLYKQNIQRKPFLIALNKIDVEEANHLARVFKENHPTYQEKIVEISALTGEGLDRLKEKLLRLVETHKEKEKIFPDREEEDLSFLFQN